MSWLVHLSDRKSKSILLIKIAMVTTCLLVISQYYFAYDGISGVSRIRKDWPFLNNGVIREPCLTIPSSACSLSVPAHKKQLLLVTYGRSGSTYTSAIISHNREVFYTAEPLHRLPPPYNIYEEPPSHAVHQKAMDVIRAFLACDIQAVDAYSYDSIMFKASNSTREFFFCVNNTKLSVTEHVGCFLKMWASCQAHNVTYVKTIRIPVAWTEWLLQHFPSLKVLYLIRDPRATMVSQAFNFKRFNLDSTPDTDSEQFCAKIRQDIEDFKRLMKIFPGRMKAIRYEDGAVRPIRYARDIYSFTGFEFDKESENFVSRITSSTNNDPIVIHDLYGYEKKNSRQSMNHWRHKISYEVTSAMDKSCGDLYSALGYVTVKTREDLLSHTPLVTDPEPNGIFDTV